ncbi:glycoside hydrolase family 30 protein [Serpula lacrymans var. lacrymans S7.3]|uniref:Glycoside hydrolase family 30 protein n=2 Tax=Serpula lacrymans var. lacrymans TaxID=341189 RepID=F8QAA5_SERL3|nr:glycoside hydrolase family 30 protein [Serpula lacrymans var. lacrymans S7.9]EGN94695.1 glycoside hydrolase family 30 protein [Serpula lacrymans var. lacrymans S7.3]EGO20173.1 glycoside hydrolase family 30 protein [Serpula lacrymans var. lacrymans S7.9]
MRSTFILGSLALLQGTVAQQITEIWQTTWDRNSLLTFSAGSVNFASPGTAASADITVDDTSVYQSMYGFGASLTDSSAQLLSTLKTQNSNNYWALLDSLFNVTDGANSAGLSYLRVPLGASDFSATVYSYDDTSGDTGLGSFNIDAAPSYVFSTLTDILSVNNRLNVHVLPWSPPAWMKSGSTMEGGSLDSQDVDTMANYLLKSLQGFQSKSIPIYAISIQNEPENSDATYPSCSMPVATEAAIGTSLRSLMDSNGFTDTKIIGFEHNWSDAANYPVQLMQQAGSAFDGVSFHCYEGTVQEMANFTSQYSTKEVYITECTGTLGSDWWSDIKWYMDNLFIVGPQYGSSNGLMWNLALDGNGNPILSGSDSCPSPGCRGVAQINNDGTYSVNQEFYAMGQASKAILPKDVGGPFGKRIGVSVAGSLGWSLIVGAYVTARSSSSDPSRYSLVVLNWDDSSSTTFNPVSVDATIEFKGMQASYTFPVGVTTLSWYD